MEHPPVTYYALDLEKRELDRTLQELSSSDVGANLQGKVATKGLCATYEDGLKFIQDGGLHERPNHHSSGQPFAHYKFDKSARDSSPSSTSSDQTHSASGSDLTPPSTPGAEEAPHHILFLGSSLGNFEPGEDAAFLRSLPLKAGSGNTLLLGLDHANGKEKIEKAYNDCKGITRAFVMNGLKNAGHVLGDESLFDESKWEYIGKYNEQKRMSRISYNQNASRTKVICRSP